MEGYFHSVTLDSEKCKGCINCIKRCPTEAIRVRDGKANIINERCIDCGECIRVCPHHAKKAIYDKFSVLKNYEYTVALPAPALYAQFNNLEDTEPVLNALKDIGFDDVYEVSSAAELISAATRSLMESNSLLKPVISSACPAVTRLIKIRFPALIPNILPLIAPVELAAIIAKAKAAEITGIPVEKIGTVFISPCPAKVTAMRNPIGIEKSQIDAVLAIKDIYPLLVNVMKTSQEDFIVKAGRIGIGWAKSGGEAAGLITTENYLAADGVENVIKVLENLEDEKLGEVDFVELNMCSGGCVGGVLTVENPYIAHAKLKKISKYLPVSKNRLSDSIPLNMFWSKDLESTLDSEPHLTRKEHFERYAKLEQIKEGLPGIDCGSCGAPNCLAFAEDVVRGIATTDACVVRMREKMENMLSKLQKENNTQNEVNL